MKEIFRKTALDKISSPDQLDQVIVITPPSFWLAMLGGGVILLVALAWGVFGRIPVKVETNGIYMSRDGIHTVYAGNAGIVKEVYVSEGEPVSKNEVLARFDTDTVRTKLKRLDERRNSVEAVTMESSGDVASADNKGLIDIKAQLLTLSANLTSNERMLAMRKAQLSEQQAKTNESLANMQLARNLYYGSMNTGSDTREQILFQQAQNNLNSAQSYYESSKSTQGSFDAQNDDNINYLNDKIKGLEIQRDSLDRSDPDYQTNYAQLQSQINETAAERDSLKDQKNYYGDSKEDREKGLRSAEAAYYNAAQAYIDAEQLRLAKQTFSNQLNDNYSVALQDYNTQLSQLRSIEEAVSQLMVQVSSEDTNVSNRYEALLSQFNGTKAAALESLDKEKTECEKELENSEIRSSLTGYIMGLNIVEGSAVQAGGAVCTVLQTEHDLKMGAGADTDDGIQTDEFGGVMKSGDVVVCYVPISDGKKIEKGMEVMVYPTTVNRQEYGHINGTVVDVADYVTSTEDIKNQLGDESLVQSFVKSGPVIAVTCELTEDPSTESGYQWSSKKGKTVALEPGTMVATDTVIEKKAPITMLIPWLKEKLTVKVQSAENGGKP